MKKRIMAFLLMLSLSVGMTFPVYAETEVPTAENDTQLIEEYMGEASTLIIPCDELPATEIMTLSGSVAQVPTEAEAYQKMIALKSSYPEGMYFTNDVPYSFEGGYATAYALNGLVWDPFEEMQYRYYGVGCAAFTYILSNAAFGDLPARKVIPVRFENVKAGDILRVDGDQHSVIVLEVKDGYVIIAEANYNESVHWGRTLSSSQVEAADYMLTRYPEGWTDQSDKTDQPDQSDKTDQPDQSDKTDQENLIQSFVNRLYDVCLDRTPDAVGLEYWTNRLLTGVNTGSEVASGFVFSDEFRAMNLCNEHYVTYLYNAMMDREPDARGLTYWLEQFENGQTREEVFNGFVVSDEFTKICADYGVQRGDGISVPQYGTVPTGACSVCGEPDGVTSFVRRLYSLCLDRDAEPDGLAYWCNQLWNHTNSGRGVAYGFVSSQEFTGKELSDEQFVEYMYRVFFDREFDSVGKGYWMNNMANGWSREQVFDGFVDSEEFDSICRRYGIMRE